MRVGRQVCPDRLEHRGSPQVDIPDDVDLAHSSPRGTQDPKPAFEQGPHVPRDIHGAGGPVPPGEQPAEEAHRLVPSCHRIRAPREPIVIARRLQQHHDRSLPSMRPAPSPRPRRATGAVRTAAKGGATLRGERSGVCLLCHRALVYERAGAGTARGSAAGCGALPEVGRAVLLLFMPTTVRRPGSHSLPRRREPAPTRARW
jgi:hypothetical protein